MKDPKQPTKIEHTENGDVRLTFDDLQPGDKILVPDGTTPPEYVEDGGSPA